MLIIRNTNYSSQNQQKYNFARNTLENNDLIELIFLKPEFKDKKDQLIEKAILLYEESQKENAPAE